MADTYIKDIAPISATGTDRIPVGRVGSNTPLTITPDQIIGLHTSATGHLELGSTSTTAAAGDHNHTAAQVGLGNVTNESKVTMFTSPTFTGTVSGVTKAMVGLGSVDNTADADKPVSTTQQTALNLKANLASPSFTGTVSGVTSTMVGLGNVTNDAQVA